MKKINILIAVIFSTPAIGTAYAAELGLTDLYRVASTKDPDFLSAQSAYESGQFNRQIGLSNLLPRVNAGYEAARNNYALQTLANPKTQDFNFTSQIYSIRLTQPLFDLSKFSSWHEGNARADYAGAAFAEARQDLMLRIAEAYFNFLLAQDNLDLAKTQKETYAERKNQNEKLFASGAGTITDAEEAKAYYQIAQSQEFAALNTLEQKRRELEKVIGTLPVGLRHVAETMPLALPEPNNLDAWITASEAQNLHAITAQINLRIAETQLDRAQAGHYPTVNLTASHQIGDDPNYFSAHDHTSKIGVVVDIPIYAGGSISANAEQSAALKEKARYDAESATADARIKASAAFYGVVNGVAQIKALEQAVKSNEVTVEGMKVGQRVGLRTNTDLLNAQQQLYTARRDLLKERYTYLLSRLQLKAATGSLQEAELQEIDSKAFISQ